VLIVVVQSVGLVSASDVPNSGGSFLSSKPDINHFMQSGQARRFRSSQLSVWYVYAPHCKVGERLKEIFGGFSFCHATIDIFA